ncbi:hypothetical protein BB560_004993 [Smittium megazygosporum]|uniref:Large ribosomal subunit protein uL6 alpha-beta domain-containing protein n=1 Tax=Smittium megazygosporum TaxID=133381 RepID=A0A2T9Z7P0_9FUNG|nr:hypothetical protein BB560_004993 [Smittium megazygosporum]
MTFLKIQNSAIHGLKRTSTILQQRSIATTPILLSNIGKLDVSYPSSVNVDLLDVNFSQDPRFKSTRTLKVTGPLGELKLPIYPFVAIKNVSALSSQSKDAKAVGKSDQNNDDFDQGKISVSVKDPKVKRQRQMWGTTRAHIQNMVNGVTEGHYATCKMVGVGYRANLETIEGKPVLQLRLGYSHPVNMIIPDHLKVEVPYPTLILIKGIDLQQVKLFAAKVREKKKPEPYNQKGIFINDETIKKKEVKKK